MSKSDALETAFLNFTYRTATALLMHTAATKAANVYFAIHSADPTDAAGGAEITTGGITRVAVPVADASWNAPAANGATMRITNAITITLPETTGNAGTATHFAIWTASSGGSILHHGALGTSRALTAAGMILSFAPGTITIDEG